VLEQIADLIAWLEPHAVILALALPPVIRVVGHWIPEELFMVAMGALAARSHSSRTAALILGAVVVSHFVTDQVVYLGGRWLRPRLGRFPRIEASAAAPGSRPAVWCAFRGLDLPPSISPLFLSTSASGPVWAGGSQATWSDSRPPLSPHEWPEPGWRPPSSPPRWW